MARIISSFEATGVKETIEKFSDLLAQQGFILDFSNLSNPLATGSPITYGSSSFSEYFIYTNSSLAQRSTQTRLKSPCGRWFIHIYAGSSNGITVSVSIPGGLGDGTSIHPTHPVDSINVSSTRYTYTYEVLKNGNSFSLYCSREGSDGYGISAAYNIPIPLTDEPLPEVSMLRVAIGATNFLEITASAFYAMSDTLIGANDREQFRSPLDMVPYPIHQSIVNIETALVPWIWANTGAYRAENLYFGRSTYPPHVISGVISLGGKEYRILSSGTSYFVAYEI